MDCAQRVTVKQVNTSVTMPRQHAGLQRGAAMVRGSVTSSQAVLARASSTLQLNGKQIRTLCFSSTLRIGLRAHPRGLVSGRSARHACAKSHRGRAV